MLSWLNKARQYGSACWTLAYPYGWACWKLAFVSPPHRFLRDKLTRMAEKRAMRSPDLDKYTYSPLRSKNNIRLLMIEPPKKTLSTGFGLLDPIRCTMLEFPLSSAPPYNALSYTWREDDLIMDLARGGRSLLFYPFLGLFDPKRWLKFPLGFGFKWIDLAVNWAIEKIANAVDASNNQDRGLRLVLCDGKAIHVTHNLHGALRVLSRLQPGYWWIDQLCINQEDIQERNAQVALMGQLYRNASKVVLWLGDETRMESRAAQGLHFVAAITDDVEEIFMSSVSFFEPSKMPDLVGLIGFFSRAWFTRLWIVQEFAVAKEATFLLGEVEIPAQVVSKALKRIEQVLSISTYKAIVSGSGIHTETRYELMDSRDYTMSHGNWSLEKWVSVARGRKTTDPRDYVFAGLSLLGRDADQAVPGFPQVSVRITQGEVIPLGADYSKSTGEAYLAMSMALLSSSLGINALSLVGTNQDMELFPSWTVNLDQPLMPKPYHQLQSRGPRVCRNLSPNTDIPVREPEIAVTADLLAMEAVYFDEIREVGEPLQHWFFDDDNRTPSFHLGDTFRLALELGPRYAPTGELVLTALWKNLVLEPERTGSPSLEDSFADAVRWYFDGSRVKTDIEKRRPQDKVPDPAAFVQHDELNAKLRSMLSLPDYRSTTFAKTILSPPLTLEEAQKDTRGFNDPSLYHETMLSFFEAFHETAAGRRLFVTQKGYLGMGPATAQPGDEVMFLRGAWTPYLFRPVHDMSQYPDVEEIVEGSPFAGVPPRTLVGEAYVHGVMDRFDDRSMLERAGEREFGTIWVI